MIVGDGGGYPCTSCGIPTEFDRSIQHTWVRLKGGDYLHEDCYLMRESMYDDLVDRTTQYPPRDILEKLELCKQIIYLGINETVILVLL